MTPQEVLERVFPEAECDYGETVRYDRRALPQLQALEEAYNNVGAVIQRTQDAIDEITARLTRTETQDDYHLTD